MPSINSNNTSHPLDFSTVENQNIPPAAPSRRRINPVVTHSQTSIFFSFSLPSNQDNRANANHSPSRSNETNRQPHRIFQERLFRQEAPIDANANEPQNLLRILLNSLESIPQFTSSQTSANTTRQTRPIASDNIRNNRHAFGLRGYPMVREDQVQLPSFSPPPLMDANGNELSVANARLAVNTEDRLNRIINMNRDGDSPSLLNIKSIINTRCPIKDPLR